MLLVLHLQMQKFLHHPQWDVIDVLETSAHAVVVNATVFTLYIVLYYDFISMAMY